MTDNPTHGGMFAAFVPLIRATDGLTLAQVCALSSLEPSTVQNWIKRGFVPHPVHKKYFERHLARIMLIADLRESMPIDRIGSLLRYINGDTDDEEDDIIPEERLYDLFHDIVGEIDSAAAPEHVVEVTVDHVARYGVDEACRERVSKALSVMAIAYMAALLKQTADRMYATL